MSKGHLEALQALRSHKPQSIPAIPASVPSVTKGMPVTIADGSDSGDVTKPKRKGGRPRLYATDAERQRACRERRKK